MMIALTVFHKGQDPPWCCYLADAASLGWALPNKGSNTMTICSSGKMLSLYSGGLFSTSMLKPGGQ